ncbi:hypothetical protein LDENG_00017220 [Lucifuga dentata]|nr:hypothetical protein LDENG_00017220 [Lucifuga dentata]
MSHLNPGLISAYNSLTDKHLAGYFSNARIRRHLQRAGLITRSGRIVPDKEYRHKLIHRAHQRHVRECLAQAIFHKVLEMERLHQIEIKRKLEEFARRERVHKIKVERSKRYEQDIIRILSPRPPTGARGIRTQYSGPEGEHSESSESPSSSRPNTAPGKMQRPVRLKPIHSNSTTASLRRSSPYRHRESSNEAEQPFNCTMDKESRRRVTTMEFPRGISPYCLPVINNFVTPVPPTTKKKDRGAKVATSGSIRDRRLHHTTASNGNDISEESHMLKSSVHQSRVCVNMVYYGKTVHLSHDLTDLRDDVKVFQQHCGGENLCVYKGKLHEGEPFQFVSRRHRGFPFSLTFFLNGLQVERLSSCCEFKHRKGSRLGGRHGHFGFSSVEGASPCYKCIIAMGLDKKPTPPPKRVKEDEETVISPKEAAETNREMNDEDAALHSESASSPPQNTEAQVKVDPPPEEEKVRDDYEEDFEADDEGPVEDAEAKEKKTPSPSSETERQIKEERDEERAETEDEKDENRPSHSACSSAGSDGEESDDEATRDSREDEEADKPKDHKEDSHEVDREETCSPAEEDKPNPEKTGATETVTKDSDMLDSPGDSTVWTELEVSDSSTPSAKQNKVNDDASGDQPGKEAEEMIAESKQEEEHERAKSVQEKLAEAILQEAQCSSEPELSDTSTEEEEEEPADKGLEQDNKDAVPEKSVADTEHQPTDTEDMKREESAAIVEEQEETSEPKNHEGETEQEPQENSDSPRAEMEEKDKDVEKAASMMDKEEDMEETDKSGDTEDIDTHQASEEKRAEEEKISEPQEDAQAEPVDAEAAEKDGENETKSAVEGDMEVKSSEEDEPSTSELKQKTDETSEVDHAEVEVMTAGQTMEMKAEPSEEQEALSCVEASVTDTERQEDMAAGGSETEATEEKSSSSSKETGDTTVVHAEKTAGTGEENMRDEPNEGDKDEAAEKVSGIEANEDDGKQEGDQEGETEKSVDINGENDKAETEKPEDDKGENKQTNEDEISEEKMEDEENITERTKDESNGEEKANEEAVEKVSDKEDDVADEEKVDKSELSNTEDHECIKSKDDGEECEGHRATTDKTLEEEEKCDEAVKDEESKEKTAKGEKIEITEEPEKSADDDMDKENETMKICDENTESQDVDDCRTVAKEHETKTEEMESENTKKEPETEINNGESCEVDAENGEISTRVENKTHVDEVEAQIQDENDTNNTKDIQDKRKKEEQTREESIAVKAETVEHNKMEDGEGDEDHEQKCEDDGDGQTPNTDMVEEGDINVDKQQESGPKDSEPETFGEEIKEESSDLQTDKNKAETEETEKNPDENTESKHSNKSDPFNEDINDAKEETGVSSGDQTQVLNPVPNGLDSTDDKLEENEESITPHDSKFDKLKTTAGDLSAVDGDNGADTEEASKPSEEGASVLVKPQPDSSQLTHNDADNNKESIALAKDVNALDESPESEKHAVTPDVLEKEDNTILVTNWITKHQNSRFFEKFVEPLEDLKEAEVLNNNTEAAQSTNGTRSVSPIKMVKISDGEVADVTEKEESEENTKVEAKTSDFQSNLSKDEEPYKNGKEIQHVREEDEVKNLIPITGSEQNGKESPSLLRRLGDSEGHKGSRSSLQEETPAHGKTEETDICKTEIAGTHHSVASGQPESFSENQEEKAIEDVSDLNERQTEIEALSPSKVEELVERSETPEKLSELASADMKASECEDTKETWEKTEEGSTAVTEVADFTKSEDGSQVKFPPKPSAGSVSGGKKDLELIKDIRHTLSKEQLSTFSVDSTLFGHSSYPLLTATQSESGH